MEQKRRSLTSSFGEHLAATLEGSTHSVYVDVLRLFAHGTWGDYKCNASRIPQLSPDQILKLKQAHSAYPCPLKQDVTNVRLLEDFLLNQCMYAGIVRGKLDQFKRCFQGSKARSTREYITHIVQLGDIDSRGHKEMFGEPSGVVDYEEYRIRPKRRRHPVTR